MFIGILSDSHGNTEAVIRAIALFKNHNVNVLLHAGDFGPGNQYEYFKGFTVHLVCGNNDDLEELKFYALQNSQPEPEYIRHLVFQDKTISLQHGDRMNMLQDAVALGYSYIVKGHSHYQEDYMKGKTRILNPGALYRSPIYSVGLLDPEKNNWKTLEIRKD